MSIRKHNEYLDGDESDDDAQNNYDSDAADESRAAVGGHANKRRRVSSDSDASEDEGEVTTDRKVDMHREDSQEEDLNEKTAEYIEPEKNASTYKLNRRMAKQLEASQKAVRKSGVIYISRVPPFMKPQTLKHFLEPHAQKGLGRIFLTPEDHAAHTRRVKSGGNKKKSFTDGWVEFNSKTEAKIAAETLNGNIIGGKKGNFYHDDLWNIKYLKGFKWNNLTEQIANENAERAARLREEIRKTREENKAFVEDIERAKMLQGMESKRNAKREKLDAAAPAQASRQVASREFKQQKVRTKDNTAKPDVGISMIQRMIFG